MYMIVPDLHVVEVGLCTYPCLVWYMNDFYMYYSTYVVGRSRLQPLNTRIYLRGWGARVYMHTTGDCLIWSLDNLYIDYWQALVRVGFNKIFDISEGMVFIPPQE